MENRESGMNYAPEGKPCPVVGPGEFRVGVIGLDHGHIYGMNKGLREAGADICKVYDPDRAKAEEFVKQFPECEIASSEDEIYSDPSIRLISCASVASVRAAVGMKALDSGKDFFSDKPPFVRQEQVDEARKKVKETGRRWFVYYKCVEQSGSRGDRAKSGRRSVYTVYKQNSADLFGCCNL